MFNIQDSPKLRDLRFSGNHRGNQNAGRHQPEDLTKGKQNAEGRRTKASQ